MQKIIVLLGVTLLSAGCASVATLPSALGSLNASSLEIHQNTDVGLSQGNFVVDKTNVVGQARGFSLLGFITIVPARFQTAIGRLYINAGLQTGKPQTLGNVVMEKSSAYYILFSIPRVYVRADVVSFTNQSVTNQAVIVVPHAPPAGASQTNKPEEQVPQNL
jgi:hypothetical protein